MVEADGVKRRGAPWQLLVEARTTAWRMVEANGADKRSASTSPLYAACTAGSVQRKSNRASHLRHHRVSSSLLQAAMSNADVDRIARGFQAVRRNVGGGSSVAQHRG